MRGTDPQLQAGGVVFFPFFPYTLGADVICIDSVMDTNYLKKIEEKHVKRMPDILPGDTVKAHLKIIEGGKQRIQIFGGVVIAVKGTGVARTMTVRKISHGVGVEKILPLNSPLIKKIDVVERGKVRRAKLYYMRNKIGKRSLDAGYNENFEAIMEEEAAKAEVKSEEKPMADEKPEEKTEKAEKPAKPEEKSEAPKEASKDAPKDKKD